ncbi:hypothetical protein COU88_05530 [Candidatus Roizmanbacteria bacterium CG10_big_fil_rev_8_21_14_0_10_39_6]|uniref:DUF4012 domain-containing protein n=1 Tax=Candidatus Roizmanbacteria bacterium CG10_big_fil_rev_8_21_14_0_10_39_6 TaxID=1974853 RepID=A0A2M8KR12_9BACT|nr:MAG: hypothetical protein COU88_05530 [Candidatus Roizmanbacteria bacterium CG10_big_fil_rev_8_21_14_0_10_39_6]
MRRKKPKKIAIVSAVLIVIIGVFITLTLVVPLVKASNRKVTLQKIAKDTFAAAKTQNLVLLETGLKKLQVEMKGLSKDLSPTFMYKHVPFVGYLFSDEENALIAADALLTASTKSVKAIEPYADLIGFKKGSEFSSQPTEKRLETAILTIDKLVPQIDKIDNDLMLAQKHLEKIDPTRYPKKIGKYVIRERVSNMHSQLLGLVSLTTDAKPLFKKLPFLLGKDEERRYLVLFVNDKELRASGGFITAYAVFSIDKGQIRVRESSDIYDLDSTISHPAAPPEILRYHKGVNDFYIRDSNLSPDYQKSIGYFEQLLSRSSRSFKYDGIISIDTNVLVNTLAILGPTEAGGVTFTADNDSRCDCAQVIYELENIITRPTGYIREERKSILSLLLYNLMQKSLGVSPSQYWGRLSQSFLTELDEKHILVHLKDSSSQKAIESLGYGGRISKTDGDYLHINNVNFAGAKSNLYMTTTVVSNAVKKGNIIAREVVITYKNDHPASDCNLERGSLCLNAPLRNWLRIYVPKGAKLVKFVGSEMQVRQYDELDKHVFEGFLVINPMGFAEIRVTYEIPLSLVKNNKYTLYIQKQPGITSQETTVSWNGQKQISPVTRDTVITF